MGERRDRAAKKTEHLVNYQVGMNVMSDFSVYIIDYKETLAYANIKSLTESPFFRRTSFYL